MADICDIPTNIFRSYIFRRIELEIKEDLSFLNIYAKNVLGNPIRNIELFRDFLNGCIEFHNEFLDRSGQLLNYFGLALYMLFKAVDTGNTRDRCFLSCSHHNRILFGVSDIFVDITSALSIGFLQHVLEIDGRILEQPVGPKFDVRPHHLHRMEIVFFVIRSEANDPNNPTNQPRS